MDLDNVRVSFYIDWFVWEQHTFRHSFWVCLLPENYKYKSESYEIASVLQPCCGTWMASLKNRITGNNTA